VGLIVAQDRLESQATQQTTLCSARHCGLRCSLVFTEPHFQNTALEMTPAYFDFAVGNYFAVM
jgi:hypothetical protein